VRPRSGTSAKPRRSRQALEKSSLPCLRWRPIGPTIGPSRENWYLSTRNHCGVDGTRTRDENKPEVPQITPDRRSEQEVQSPRAPPESNRVQPNHSERGADLERAIARVTRALSTADDDAIAGLVAERRAMRAELEAIRLPSKVIALTSPHTIVKKAR
jgi:hypothetical protein